MYRREYNVVFPILLIGIGSLILMQNAGLLAVSAWELLLKLWPLLLVAWGLQGVLGRSAPGALLAGVLTLALGAGVIWYAAETGALTASPLNSRAISQALNDAREAEVEINFSIGDLSIAALEDSTQLIEGTVTQGSGLSVRDEFRMVDNTAHYSLHSEGVAFLFSNMNWDLNLTGRVPLDLKVHNGVGSATIDLSQLDIRQATIEGGVGEIHLTAPRSGRPSVRIDQGVGTVRVFVPRSMEARLTFHGGLGDVQIDSRFRAVGEDVYETAGFAGADQRVEIEVDRGVGTLILE